jgi:hypothetical protein
MPDKDQETGKRSGSKRMKVVWLYGTSIKGMKVVWHYVIGIKSSMKSVTALPAEPNRIRYLGGGQSLPFVVMPAGAALLGVVFWGGMIGAAIGGAIGLVMAIMDLRSVKQCLPKD